MLPSIGKGTTHTFLFVTRDWTADTAALSADLPSPPRIVSPVRVLKQIDLDSS